MATPLPSKTLATLSYKAFCLAEESLKDIAPEVTVPVPTLVEVVKTFTERVFRVGLDAYTEYAPTAESQERILEDFLTESDLLKEISRAASIMTVHFILTPTKGTH